MDETFIELIEGPEIQLNITEYNPDFEILNDRSDKSSSGVWKHFGTIKYHDAIDKKHVYCTHCFANRRIKKYQRSTSTGNLSKHLRKQHNISLNQIFRVKKDADNLIHLVKTETEDDIEKDAGNSFDTADGEDEYLVHDINEILISEVAKRPLLYKPQTCQQEKGAKHVIRRQQWTEVYEALNRLIPLPKIPKIWKNIRDRYHKVRRSTHLDSDGKPKYRYYEHLSFLDNIGDDQKTLQYEVTEEEADVDEFLISGDHDHYISPETIVLPNDAVAYEETSCEPPRKKQKVTPKKQQTTYQIISHDGASNKLGKSVAMTSSNIIEESFVNATSSDIFTFEQELVNDEIKHSTMMNQSNGIEVISNTQLVPPGTNVGRKQDEFDMFGNFVAEVMRNMTKSKSRILQMNIMKLINEADAENDC